MTHNLLGVGDDRWLRESLRRDPLQELRECKEELARKVNFQNCFCNFFDYENIIFERMNSSTGSLHHHHIIPRTEKVLDVHIQLLVNVQCLHKHFMATEHIR